MEISDESLIHKTLDGSIDSFDELMRRYERAVFKLAYSFGGSRENALDLTQTVFLKAFNNLRTFRAESSFKTWLFRITYNEGINWIASPRNRAYLHRDIDSESRVFSSEAGQETNLLIKEQRQLIRKGLNSLNDRYRIALVLRYVHELTIHEIATVLQCSEAMTKNMLFRGIRNLRRVLIQPPQERS